MTKRKRPCPECVKRLGLKLRRKLRKAGQPLPAKCFHDEPTVKCARHHAAHTANNAARRAGLNAATPRWADRLAIRSVYAEAFRLTIETGVDHEVDHIVPLNHPLVCGLHVPWNLRAIPAAKNRKKGNSFQVG